MHDSEWNDPLFSCFENQRIHARVPIDMKVTLHSVDDSFEGTARDISEGGAFILTSDISPNRAGDVTMKVQIADEILELNGVIKWAHKGADMPSGLGVQWDDLSETALESIQKHVQTRQAHSQLSES